MSNLTYARVYFEKASKLYADSGNQNSAYIIDQMLTSLDKELEKVSTAHLKRACDWDTQQSDFQLDRQFQQMIDRRNQDRIDTERRHERIDRHIR